MYLISQLITKEWFKALFGSIIILFLLVTVGDIINGFLRGYPASRVFIEYALKLPMLASKMIPICALLASLFAINKLKNSAELMAILAGGFSAKKIYTLIFSISLTVAIFQLLNLGFIMPYANKVKRNQFEKSRRNESKYLARSKVGQTGLIWYKSSNYFTSFVAFDSDKKELKDVSIYFLSPESHLHSIYQAKSATYLGDEKWKLTETKIVQELEKEQFPLVTETNKLVIKLKEAPSDFQQFKSDITTLNMADLRHFITRLQETAINSAEYEVMYFEIYSLSLICIVFALFPVSGVFNPNRRSAGFGKSIVVTLAFSIFFWGAHSGVVSLGNTNKIPPLMATMLLPLVFFVVIAYTFIKNRKLS